MIGQAGLLGTTLAVGLPTGAKAAEAAAEPSKKAKLKVVVTGGHPGDPEYGCGGTVARYADLGHEVILLYLNEGEPGKRPKEGDEHRVAEATKACEILGARPLFAGQMDGASVLDAEHYDQFRKILENEQPNIVFTQWPIDNHRDHRAISMLVYDAWRQMGRKFAFYYYEVSNGEDTIQFAPTHYVDITATADRKRKACFAHASQTPERYYELQEMVTRMRGIESGHKLAEAYIRLVQGPDFGLPNG